LLITLNENCLKKNYFLPPVSFTLLIGVFFVLLGCSHHTEEKITFFGGKIKNPKGEYVYLNKNKKVIDSAKLDPNNKFRMKLDSIEIGLYTFNHGPEFQYLYLEPSDSLLIYLNTWDFDETLIFSGKGSAKNNFLINLYLEQEKIEKDFQYEFELNEEEFSKKIDERKEKLLENYNQLIESEGKKPSEFFDLLAKTGINIPFYYLKEHYAYSHQRALKLNETTELSDDFYNYRKEIDLNIESLLDYSWYVSYVVTYLYNLAYVKKYDNPEKDNIQLNYMEVVKEKITIESFKNKLLARAMWGSLTYKDVSKEDMKTIEDFFFDNCTGESYLTELKKSIEQRNILVCGEELPKLTVYNINDEEVVLNNIAKGSNTIIYFWPTDLGGIELLNESLTYYKKNYPEVLFIGIERNKNNDDWKEFVQKKELPIDTQYKIAKNSEAYSWFEGEMARTIIINDKGNVENGYLFFVQNKNEIKYYLKNLKKH
jgi:hypothetical protein